MSHGKAIAKNAAWLMIATTAQKIIAFLSFTVIARLVGVEVTGQYFFVISISSVFVVLTDLGLTPVVIREMAQNEERGLGVFKRALQAKRVLIPIAILAAIAYGLTVGMSETLFIALLCACFVMSADALTLVWYGFIRGKRQLRFEALGMLCTQLVAALISITMAVMHGGVIGLAIGLASGSAFNLLWSRWKARQLGVHLESVSVWSWKDVMKAALPFAIAGLCVKVYSYVDTLMLRQIWGEVAVGYYAVAYKVTYAFQFLPLAFVAALYPGMSAAYASKERGALQGILEGSLRLMMLIAAPLAALLSAFSSVVILRVYGAQYAGSILPLAILPWVLIPIFVDFPIGSLLNATHRAIQKTTAMFITMIVNVIGNAILVPLYGPSGAAWSGVISFWCLVCIGIWFIRKDLSSLFFLVSLFMRGLLVAGLLWLFVVKALAPFMLPLQVVGAGLMALVLVIVFRLLQWQDIVQVRGWFTRRNTV